VRANTGQPSGARAASRFRTSLVTAQIALSMTLLILAGLFVKSLMNVSRVDLGVRIDNVLTFAISPELNGYQPARSKVLFRRVEEELSALPGVTSVSASLVPLLAGSNWGNDVSVEGFKRDPDTDANSRFNEIGPGYFRTLGVPLRAGREFTAADEAGAPKVAIVNEAFAKKFNLGQNAVGKRIGTGRNRDVLDIEIVGVVPDVKYSEVKQEIPPVFFRPVRQDTTLGWANFYVRTSQEPSQLLRVVPEVIKKLDPNLPVEGLKTMPQQVRENVFLDRMISTLSAGFAVLATLLAAVGLYGVLAYTVAQRTREIGVRMALGADARKVRRMVLRQVGVMTLVGGIVGVGAALGLGKLAGSMLFGLQGNDPVVIAVSAFLLVIVAFVAGEIPAMRAARIHPMQALRYE
jgi:predicted permease